MANYDDTAGFKRQPSQPNAANEGTNGTWPSLIKFQGNGGLPLKQQPENVFAQAQAQIILVGNGLGQSQANIESTLYVFAQAHSSILAQSYGFGQSQTDIKAIGYGFGQAQSDIKQTYHGHAQAQANIEATYYVFAQAQGEIESDCDDGFQADAFQADAFQMCDPGGVTTYYAHGQSQTRIKNTYYTHAQAQAIITVPYGHAQAQAYLLGQSHKFAQAQGTVRIPIYGVNIVRFPNGGTPSYSASSTFSGAYPPSDAADGAVGPGDTSDWASAGESAGAWWQVDWTIAQEISQVVLYDRPNLVDKWNAGTISFSDGSSVSHGTLPDDGTPLATNFPTKIGIRWMRITTTTASAANVGLAEVEGYSRNVIKFAQAQAYILNDTYGRAQAQADIKATSYVFAQAQADIEQTYFVHAQAQADILQVYYGLAQSQANVKNTYYGLAQAQASIEATIYVFAQAQASMGGLFFGYAQAQANIEAVGYAHAQSQANIEAVDYGFGQAQADIEQTYHGLAQAQANIENTYYSHGQSQANIEAISYAHAQSQANIEAQGYGFGQAQSDIEQTYYSHAQAQSFIVGTYYVFAQAQGYTPLPAGYAFANAVAIILVTSNTIGQSQAKIEYPDTYTACVNSTPDLISHYRFDSTIDTTTVVSDDNGLNNGAPVNGPLTYVTTNALHDGSSALDLVAANRQAVAVPSSPSLNSPSMSWVAWVTPDIIDSGNRRIFQKTSDDTQWRVLIFESGGFDYIYLTLTFGVVNEYGATFPLGAHGDNLRRLFLAFTYNAVEGHVRLYVNYYHINYGGDYFPPLHNFYDLWFPETLAATSGEMYIGGKPGSIFASDYFDGRFEDFAIYGRELTEEEVLDLYYCGRNVTLAFGQAHAYIYTSTKVSANTSASIFATSAHFAQATALIQSDIKQAFGQSQALINSIIKLTYAQSNSVIFYPLVDEFEDVDLNQTVLIPSTINTCMVIPVDGTLLTAGAIDPSPFYGTLSPPDGSWIDDMGPDAPTGWASFTASVAGYYTFDTYEFLDFDHDTVLGIYTADSGPGHWVYVAVNDDSEEVDTFESLISVYLTAGLYYLFVGFYDGAVPMTAKVRICLNSMGDPGNGHSQAQANIRRTGAIGAYESLAQARAFIFRRQGYAQARAEIIPPTRRGYAQAIADIKKLNNVWAQANALIDSIIKVQSGQAAALINSSIKVASAQAHASIYPVLYSVIKDNFIDAYDIITMTPGCRYIVEDMTSYTYEAADPDPLNDSNNDEWDDWYTAPNGWLRFRIEGPYSYTLHVDTNEFGTNDHDTLLAIYTGNSVPGSWVWLAADDDAGTGNESSLDIVLPAGDYILLVGFWEDSIPLTVRVNLCVTLGPTRAYGQAQAFISQPITRRYGQAQARMRAFNVSRTGQARSRIRVFFNPRRAQAQALIEVNANQMFSQAQAFIHTPLQWGQAQAFINAPYKHAQAQAYLDKPDHGGQAQAQIKQTYYQHAQAQALIRKFVGFAQAQANIEELYFRWGLAQADIVTNNNTRSAQALATITRREGYAQALAYIVKGWGFAQGQAFIRRTTNYGHAQGRVLIKRTFETHGLANARIVDAPFIQGPYMSPGTANALIQIPNFKRHAQARARIISFGTFGFAQAQATTPVPDGRPYYVNFNGYTLPGYAQQESFDSTMIITEGDTAYIDGSLSEYMGLENKHISVTMKVTGDTYFDMKTSVQEAGIMLRSSRKEFVKLYIQRPDRYYLVKPRSISMESDARNRYIDYSVAFEAKPWLLSDIEHDITGTGVVDTDQVGRTTAEGGWTPATLILTGTNITVSGYTATAFTGFVSISGAVTNFIIDSETYSASDNTVLNNEDFQIYVGPGKTWFEITGASSCIIRYKDRWYL